MVAGMLMAFLVMCDEAQTLTTLGFVAQKAAAVAAFWAFGKGLKRVKIGTPSSC